MKKTIVILFVTLTSLILPFESKAQEGIDDILKTFFQYYGEGKTDQAVDYVFSTNTYLGSAQQQIIGIKEKLKTITSVIGTYYGYEKVIQKEMGKSYIIVKCMVRHDRQPLFFSFMFYRPDQKWQLQSLRFDDKLEDDDLQEIKNTIQ